MENSSPIPTSVNDPISIDISHDNKGDISKFITLGLLAKKFDAQEITIRRAFKKFIDKGLMIENKDFVKANYKNPRNFTYMLDGKKFIALVKQSNLTNDNRVDNNLLSLHENYLRLNANHTEIEIDNSDIDSDNTAIPADNNIDNSALSAQGMDSQELTKQKEKTGDIKPDNGSISNGNTPDNGQNVIVEILKDSHLKVEQVINARLMDAKEMIKDLKIEIREKNIQIGKHQKAGILQQREIQNLHQTIEDKDKEINQNSKMILMLQEKVHQIEQPKIPSIEFEQKKDRRSMKQFLWGLVGFVVAAGIGSGILWLVISYFKLIEF